jgi:hypothetical protein
LPAKEGEGVVDGVLGNPFRFQREGKVLQDQVVRLRNLARLYARKKLASLPRKLPVTEEDLAQSAMADMIEFWVPGRCSAEAFVCGRVRHEIDALLRRKETRSVQFGDEDNVIEFPDPARLPDQDLIPKEYEVWKRELLAFVGERHRGARDLVAIILAHDEELRRTELATLLNVEKSHIDYLRKVLRKIIEEFKMVQDAR